MKKQNINIPKEKIADFCQRHYIKRLALFGSALRDDFTPGFISKYFRHQVLEEAKDHYVSA